MHPSNLLAKAIAEIAKIATPPGSTANQIATFAKQVTVLLDGVTAQTPMQRVHALASMLGECVYFVGDSKQIQNIATTGNVILLLFEALHYMDREQQIASSVYQYLEPEHYDAFEREFMQIAAKQEALYRKRWNEQLARQQAEIQALRRKLGLPDM